MPSYSHKCDECEHEFDFEMGLTIYSNCIDRKTIKDKGKPSWMAEPPPPAEGEPDIIRCPECGSENTYSYYPEGRDLQFIYKGDGWADKNARINKQMREKNARLASKEREMKGDGLIPQLVPNVDGERVDSWQDATKMAKAKGKDTTGYDKYAQKEQKQKKQGKVV